VLQKRQIIGGGPPALARTIAACSTSFQISRKDIPLANRSASADFVTAFATGWPENQPDLMVLSLTTSKGVQDFAVNKSQALLIAKTIKETAAQLKEPKRDR
jgi:hypothetical protein